MVKMDLFRHFFKSEKAGGFILVACTIFSIILANSSLGENYIAFWHSKLDLSFSGVYLNYSIEHWINDGLMAIFFLLVGLEIERELFIGELSSFKNAMLPVVAAVGGMAVPALIHFIFNAGTATESGFGIPMATDIAFALGILSLAGNRVPVSLKIFLTALAIIDDLGAIVVIAVFYSESLSLYYLIGALVIFLLLFIAGKKKVYNLAFYLIGGVVMWYFMLKSGVHATIAGVLLAFAIPFPRHIEKNPSYKLQHALHYPVAFIILPVFALANTAISFPKDIFAAFTSPNSLGIIFGLVVGKFVGIFLASFAAVKSKFAVLSKELSWWHIAGAACLGGIGFTMSIFIANLAFGKGEVIVASKMSILLASILAALIGLFVLTRVKRSIVIGHGKN
jgi:Na+:H+ antiporter, NhaA family